MLIHKTEKLFICYCHLKSQLSFLHFWFLNVLANPKEKKVERQTELCQDNPSVAKGCLVFLGKQKIKNSL